MRQFKDDILPHYRLMWQAAYAVLGDREAAADAVQDCMVKLWDRRHLLGNVGNLRAYCVRVARNEALTSLRDRRSPCVTADATGVEPVTEYDRERVEYADAVSTVSRVIDSMPPSHAEVMRLSSFAGMSNSEISDVTGLSADNVRVILSRGRRKLKSLFEKILDR